MSSGDDMSDSSNTTGASPVNSPQSPFQQVPELMKRVGMNYNDTLLHQGARPYLKIIEQPQDHFRFRYRSEMVGTHGCLLGRSENSTKGKTHPTVELVNFEGKARIRCRLVQNDNDHDHPHQLEDEDDRDFSVEVAASKIVKFAGLGIIHTAKKDVAQVLFKKYSKELGPNVDMKGLRTRCDKLAKEINLNIVRLKFSAHDTKTDEEICPPVYSDPIHNMKSALTNELKICRISKAYGSVRGKENLFLLVEKVNKKDIEVHFVQVCPKTNKELWRQKGLFSHNDVHHQYAIVCKTPAYKDQDVDTEIPVYIELVRPSNGRTSERLNFTYKSENVFKNKKRKYDSYESFASSLSDSLKSTELPTTVVKTNALETNPQQAMNINFANQISCMLSTPPPSSDILAEAIIEAGVYKNTSLVSPVLSQPNVPSPMVQLRPEDLYGIIDRAESDKIQQQALQSEDFETFLSSGVMDDVLKHCYPNDAQLDLMHIAEDDSDFRKLYPNHNAMDFNKFNSEYPKFAHLQSDGVKQKAGEKAIIAKIEKISITPKEEEDRNSYSPFHYEEEGPQIKRAKEPRKRLEMSRKMSKTANEEDKNNGYSALYSEEDGLQVKKLIKEICLLMKPKKNTKRIDDSQKEEVRAKLEQLMKMRLDNGDTFLHMTLCFNMLPSMEFIVKLIHSLNMTQTLNLVNNKSQTILHLAIMNNMPDYVAFLIAKGCDPMIKDHEGNNALHYAVIYKSCLSSLLCAIKSNHVSCNLDRYNNDQQTALHIAAQYGPAESVSLLLSHGADCGVRDIDGRTPLHLAAYDDSVANMEALLVHIPDNEIDAVDRNGNTPLQIACGLQHEHSVDIARLLLNKGANPLKFDDKRESAWASTEKNLELRALLKAYISSEYIIDEDIKSEPDDDYESTEEDFPDSGMDDLPKYVHEVSTILDRSDAWRELAKRLHQDTLLNWYEKLPSPTSVLLAQVKESQENFTSRSLAMILNDMGETEAANIIYRSLD